MRSRPRKRLWRFSLKTEEENRVSGTEKVTTASGAFQAGKLRNLPHRKVMAAHGYFKGIKTQLIKYWSPISEGQKIALATKNSARN